MATSSGIVQSYLNSLTGNGADVLRHKENVRVELDYIKLLVKNQQAKGGDFANVLAAYLPYIEDSDGSFIRYEVMIPFMDEKQKRQLEWNLHTTKMLLLAQKKYETDRQQHESVKRYSAGIDRCTDLLLLMEIPFATHVSVINAYKIELINQMDDAKKEEAAKTLRLSYQMVLHDKEQSSRCAKLLDALEPKTSPEQGYGTDGQPVKYLGIELAKVMSSKIAEFMNRKTKTIKEAMGSLNEKRLYWVWGSTFLKTMLESMADNFLDLDDARKTIATPDPFTGTLSWALYYFRFALNLFLLLKHTIKGPWMSETEQQLSLGERFKTQWAQRKFALLNDSLWATANLVSFFWLCGNSVLGSAGDLLTLGLLIFDISMAVWDFEEQKTAYNQALLQFDIDIKELNQKISDQGALASDEKSPSDLLWNYQSQLAALKREQRKTIQDWKFKKIELINNLAYASGLMLAFAVMTLPFIPVAAPAMAILKIVGAVLCLALTVINNSIKGGGELFKTNAALSEIKPELEKKREHFNELHDEAAKKLLFLEIKSALAETEYQQKLAIFQTVQLVRSTLFESLIPAMFLVTLVCLPIGTGIGIIGGIIGFAIASNLIINALLKPADKPKLEFDEAEYQQFCDDNKPHDKSALTKLSLFAGHHPANKDSDSDQNIPLLEQGPK